MKILSPLVMTTLLAAGTTILSAQETTPASQIRSIRLVQDDAQVRIASKIYELKHVKATDIAPYIEAAVKRYDAQSLVQRVDYTPKKKIYLIVSTAEKFMPYVDDLIAKIDRPGKADKFGSLLEGTGVVRVAYHPDYRAAEDIAEILTKIVASNEGSAYLNPETNTIYWKDEKHSAMRILDWVRKLDRPLPQANLRINYYEVRESTLRDIGLDYLAWKNGPGVNFLSLGYNSGKLVVDEIFTQLLANGALADFASAFSTSWGYGGFFTAPYFDMSFIRLLQQSGNAKLAANGSLTFINTPIYENPARNRPKRYFLSLRPDYQNIAKNESGRTYIGESDNSDLKLEVFNPVICFDSSAGAPDQKGFIPTDKDFYDRNAGTLIFTYNTVFKNVVERGDTGAELANSTTLSNTVTLPFKQEKIIATYEKENEVEQNIGFPFFSRLPYLKYLFGTTTTIKERTYIIVSAEATLVHPEFQRPAPVSRTVETKKIFEDMN